MNSKPSELYGTEAATDTQNDSRHTSLSPEHGQSDPLLDVTQFNRAEGSAHLGRAQTQCLLIKARIKSAPVTVNLTYFLVTIFLLQLSFPIAPAQGLVPSPYTNVAFGALYSHLLSLGEWWRLCTAPLIHGGPIHLITDVLAIAGVGLILEPLIGRVWFAALLVLGGISGSVTSWVFIEDNGAAVGTAGAMMSILAANLICSFRFSDPEMRRKMQKASGGYLVPALIGTFGEHGYPVDVAGHIGGTIAGFLYGGLFLLIWPKDIAQPRFKTLALTICVSFLLVSVFGFIQSAIHYNTFVRLHAALVPPNEYPRSTADALKRTGTLVALYPHDPRAHIWHGLSLYTQRDFAKAEEEFRTAQRLPPNPLLPRSQAELSTAYLAETLYVEGRMAEAREVASPICSSNYREPMFREINKRLWTTAVCGHVAGFEKFF